VDIQPKVSEGNTGQNSDEDIITDVASSILENWPDEIIINRNEDRPVTKKLFEKDATGRMINSLSTVLLQESERFNKLIVLIRNSLECVLKAVKGLIVMSPALEQVVTSLRNNDVPQSWSIKSYPSLKRLGSWVKDFHCRIEMIKRWIVFGQPSWFWLPGLFYPQGFLTAILQNHARSYKLPIDSLRFEYDLQSYKDETELDDSKVDGEHGEIIGGLYIEGARWDREALILRDQFPMEMFSAMPFIRFVPTSSPRDRSSLYACPLYKTPARAGVLSTTGQSTNFVVTIYIPSDRHSDFWIAKGTALLCQFME